MHDGVATGRTGWTLCFYVVCQSGYKRVTGSSHSMLHGESNKVLALPRAMKMTQTKPPRREVLHVPAEAGGVCGVVRLRPPVLRRPTGLLHWQRRSGEDPVGCK